MDKKQELYENIEREFAQYKQQILMYSEEEILKRAEEISDMQNIYEYLMRDKSFDETEVAYYLKLENPLHVIYKSYQEDKPSIYNTLNQTLWNIRDKDIGELLDPVSPYIKELIEELDMEVMENEYTPEIDICKMKRFLEDLSTQPRSMNEYSARILLQFKRPIEVISDFYKNEFEPFKESIRQMMERIRSYDILTQPYELNHERILPETKQKHEAIHRLLDIVPKFNFQTTANWLEFFYDLYDIEEAVTDDDPYSQFVLSLENVRDNYGDAIVQKLYDIGIENVILEWELEKAAEYLANGGDIAKVLKMANESFFSGVRSNDETTKSERAFTGSEPEHTPLKMTEDNMDEENRQGNQQGGMDLS